MIDRHRDELTPPRHASSLGLLLRWGRVVRRPLAAPRRRRGGRICAHRYLGGAPDLVQLLNVDPPQISAVGLAWHCPCIPALAPPPLRAPASPPVARYTPHQGVVVKSGSPRCGGGFAPGVFRDRLRWVRLEGHRCCAGRVAQRPRARAGGVSCWIWVWTRDRTPLMSAPVGVGKGVGDVLG
jgi:hypothetical protein